MRTYCGFFKKRSNVNDEDKAAGPNRMLMKEKNSCDEKDLLVIAMAAFNGAFVGGATSSVCDPTMMMDPDLLCMLGATGGALAAGLCACGCVGLCLCEAQLQSNRRRP